MPTMLYGDVLGELEEARGYHLALRGDVRHFAALNTPDQGKLRTRMNG